MLPDAHFHLHSYLPLPGWRLSTKMAVETPTSKRKRKEIKSKRSLDTLDEGGNSENEPSDESEDLCVYETAEDIRKVHETAEMKLSRLGHRETLWTGKISSYFVILTFLCTYDSMITYSFYMGEYGTPFAITYMVMMILVGFPLLYMEMALGQYTSCNGYAVFQQMAAAMAGIGMASLILNFASLVNEQMLVTYFANLFVNSPVVISTVLVMNTSRTTDSALKKNRKLGLYFSPMGNICYRSKMGIIENNVQKEWKVRITGQATPNEWFRGESLGQHIFANAEFGKDHLLVVTWPNYEFLLYMFLSLTVVYLICQKKGFIAKLGKISFFLLVVVVGTLIVTIFFGAKKEMAYLDLFRNDDLKAKQSVTDSLAMISCAALLVLKTLKLGQGGIIYLASQNRFRNSLVKDCILITSVVVVVQMVYTLCHGMVIKSHVMFLASGNEHKFNSIFEAHNKEQDTDAYAFRTHHSIFKLATFVQALRMYGETEPVIVCVVSMMGTLVTIACKVIRAEILVSTITDSFPIISDTMSKKVVLHLTICLCSIFAFFLSSAIGFEMMIAFEEMIVPILGGAIVLCELLAVVFLYGPRRLLANIMTMNMRKNHKQESYLMKTLVNAIIIGLWSFVIPVILCFSAVTRMTIGFHARLAKSLMDLPVMFTFGVIFIIPVLAAKRIVEQYHSSSNVKPVLSPNRDLWGPRSSEDRQMALKIERMFRA